MQEFIEQLEAAMDAGIRLNEQGKSTRSRALSVTLTHLETALLWAREAKAAVSA